MSLLFPNSVRMCSNFVDLLASIQLSQHHWLKRLFPIVYSCLLCWRLIDHRCKDLFPGSLLFFVPIPHHFDYFSFVVLLLTVLEKAKQWNWAAFKLPWDPGQCSFYHITLHFEEFGRVSSLWKSSKQIYLPLDVQGEKFVISLDTNSCVTRDKSVELLQFVHL